jgi:hypothetical protein
MTAPLHAPVSVDFKATGVEQVRNGLKLVGKEGDANLAEARYLLSATRLWRGVHRARGETDRRRDEADHLPGRGDGVHVRRDGGDRRGDRRHGLAIYEHITGKIQEAKDELNKFRGDLEQFKTRPTSAAPPNARHPSTAAIRTRLGRKVRPTFSSLARSQGIAGLRTRLAQQQAELAKNHSIYKQGSQEADAVRETNAELTKQLQLYREIAAVTGIGEHGEIAKTGLVAKSGEQTKTGFQLAIDKAQARRRRRGVRRRGETREHRRKFGERGSSSRPSRISACKRWGTISPTDSSNSITRVWG